MKNLFLIISVWIVSSLALANSSDQVCKVSGTSISIDIASGTPADEGSRFFEGLYISLNGSQSQKPDFTIDTNSKDYFVSYADGLLGSGAYYFMVNVVNRKTGKNLYAFWKTKTAIAPAYSVIYSTLPFVKIPATSKATLQCD